MRGEAGAREADGAVREGNTRGGGGGVPSGDCGLESPIIAHGENMVLRGAANYYPENHG